MSNVKNLKGNFIALSLMQFVNLILPLLTIPYLSKTLGTEMFGLTMFSQAFIQYFMIIVDFGFNLSATKNISVNRDNKSKVNEIFSSVMILKILLLILSFICFIILILVVGKFNEYWYIYLLNFGVVVGYTLFPVWLFQGMEKMKYTTVLYVIAKSTFTIMIFIFVNSKEDVFYVPLLNSVGYIVSGIIGVYLSFKMFKIRFEIPNSKIIFSYFKESVQYFTSRVSVSVYTTTNSIVIGFLFGNTAVGYYSIAEKIINIINVGVSIIIDTIYPYMARSKDLKLFKNIFGAVLFLSAIGCEIIFIFSDEVILMIFKQEYLISSIILKIMLIATFISIPSMLLGYPLLAAFGHVKYANYSVIIASIVHMVVLLITIFIPNMNMYMITAILILTQLLVLVIRLYGVKNKILK